MQLNEPQAAVFAKSTSVCFENGIKILKTLPIATHGINACNITKGEGNQFIGDTLDSYGGPYEEDFCSVAPCGLTEVYRHLRGACRLHHPGDHRRLQTETGCDVPKGPHFTLLTEGFVGPRACLGMI